MKIDNNKLYKSIYDRTKIPRKIKKFMFGTKMNRCQIKSLLKQIKLGEPIQTMYERREIFPYAFCPKCGHAGYHGRGNKTSYPEHWEYFHCNKCFNIVGHIDNSPFIHVLEDYQLKYNPEY